MSDDVLHRMMRHQSIPRAPKSAHVLEWSKRNANVFFERGIIRPDEHTFPAQHFRRFLAGRKGSQQNEVRFGIEAAQHPRIRLIEEFLPVVRIERNHFLYVSRIREGRNCNARGDSVNASWQPPHTQLLGGFR